MFKAAKARADALRKARRRARTLSSAKTAVQRNPYGFAFQLGWKIGTMIFRDPLRDPEPAAGEEGQAGWYSSGWTWDGCNTDGNREGTIRFTAEATKNVNGCTLLSNIAALNYATPNAVVADQATNGFANHIGVEEVDGHQFGASLFDVVKGQWERTGVSDDVFYNDELYPAPVLVPGYGTPLAPYPSEHPELAPAGQPAQVPSPQKWADAAPGDPSLQPSKKDQLKARTRPSVRIAPGLEQPPLVPFRLWL